MSAASAGTSREVIVVTAETLAARSARLVATFVAGDRPTADD